MRKVLRLAVRMTSEVLLFGDEACHGFDEPSAIRAEDRHHESCLHAQSVAIGCADDK